MHYYLQPGDLIITDDSHGICIKKNSKQWKYACTRKSSEAEWSFHYIDEESLYRQIDAKTLGAIVSYVPGREREERQRV